MVLLATSDTFDISALTESYQLVDFPFSGANRINLGDGTRYFLVIDCPDSSGNYVKIGIDTSSPTHGVGKGVKKIFSREEICNL